MTSGAVQRSVTAVGALGLLLSASPGYGQTYQAATMAQIATAPPAASKDTAIRQFKFHASDEAIADLRRRIAATAVAREGDGRRSVAGGAALDDSRARELLGGRITTGERRKQNSMLCRSS